MPSSERSSSQKRALPSARVGGPHVAGTKSPEATKFLRDFLEHCLRGKNHATGKTGSPLDFVAFHAKGEPRFVEGHLEVAKSYGVEMSDGRPRMWVPNSSTVRRPDEQPGATGELTSIAPPVV